MSRKLFDEVTELTGLPLDFIQPELERLLEKKGFSPEDLTTDALREVLTDLLQDIILSSQASSDEQQRPPETSH